MSAGCYRSASLEAYSAEYSVSRYMANFKVRETAFQPVLLGPETDGRNRQVLQDSFKKHKIDKVCTTIEVSCIAGMLTVSILTRSFPCRA